mmetsp:Transcript_19623/g.54696  ORF Transcript_19623/g.54696 Transcript_19623/m.54696 type:complete len:281 (+) Transcript_19623:945-1787(+)
MRVFTAPTEAATGSTCWAACSAASLWGMVTLKPWKSVCSWKAARKRDMSSTSRGTYTPSKPTCWNAVLWSSGEREWDTGLPMMPKTLVAAVWPWKLNRVFSSCMSGCPGADAFSGLMAANVRWPPYLAASRRVITPFSPMASAMVGTGGFFSKDSTAALSVMSLAMVAILTTSAPAACISWASCCNSAAGGVIWKLCEDRITLHVVGTSPRPAKKMAAALYSTSMYGAPLRAAYLRVASRSASGPSKFPPSHLGRLVTIYGSGQEAMMRSRSREASKSLR